ncbi:hypothetical protein VTO73DRAFT_2670 [Trametes versicolor]
MGQDLVYNGRHKNPWRSRLATRRLTKLTRPSLATPVTTTHDGDTRDLAREDEQRLHQMLRLRQVPQVCRIGGPMFLNVEIELSSHAAKKHGRVHAVSSPPHSGFESRVRGSWLRAHEHSAEPQEAWQTSMTSWAGRRVRWALNLPLVRRRSRREVRALYKVRHLPSAVCDSGVSEEHQPSRLHPAAIVWADASDADPKPGPEAFAPRAPRDVQESAEPLHVLQMIQACVHPRDERPDVSSRRPETARARRVIAYEISAPSAKSPRCPTPAVCVPDKDGGAVEGPARHRAHTFALRGRNEVGARAPLVARPSQPFPLSAPPAKPMRTRISSCAGAAVGQGCGRPCGRLAVSRSPPAACTARARAPSRAQSLCTTAIVLALSSAAASESGLQQTIPKRPERPARRLFVPHLSELFPLPAPHTTTVCSADSAAKYQVLHIPAGRPCHRVQEGAGAGAATRLSSAIACEWDLFRGRVLHHSRDSERGRDRLAAATCGKATSS